MVIFVYILQSNGVLKVKIIFLLDIFVVILLVRVGLVFEMLYVYNKVFYLGCGEYEIYIDCNQFGCIGIYYIDVECMFYYYVKFQVIGNCMDVCWMELVDEVREGLFFCLDKVFQFSVILFMDFNVD